MTLDHHGNTLAPARCPLCRACWLYVRMADPRSVSMLGRCIYGGPFSRVVSGYRPGEVEAARARAYGEPQLIGG